MGLVINWDSELKNLDQVSDKTLEELWQRTANKIENCLQFYYAKHDETWREKAVQAQDRQQEVEREITRRSRLEEDCIKEMKEQTRRYNAQFSSCPCGRTSGDGYCDCYDY